MFLGAQQQRQVAADAAIAFEDAARIEHRQARKRKMMRDAIRVAAGKADIAKRLLELLETREARQELSFRGRERARAFSWARSATETLAVFEQVLSS